MINEIKNWLRQGCEIRSGIELYKKYGSNKKFLMLCELYPEKYKKRLISQLCRLVNISEKDIQKPTLVSRSKFRDEYPFLKDPTCPYELKVLVAEKITAYHKYVDTHEQLFDCTDAASCLDTARTVVNNFIENREIKKELDYYKYHKNILGLHSIFKQTKRLSKIRNMSIRDLVKKEQNLEHNIWRIKNEIEKGDKPRLLNERERRIVEKQAELEYVRRMLGE